MALSNRRKPPDHVYLFHTKINHAIQALYTFNLEEQQECLKMLKSITERIEQLIGEIQNVSAFVELDCDSSSPLCTLVDADDILPQPLHGNSQNFDKVSSNEYDDRFRDNNSESVHNVGSILEELIGKIVDQDHVEFRRFKETNVTHTAQDETPTNSVKRGRGRPRKHTVDRGKLTAASNRQVKKSRNIKTLIHKRKNPHPTKVQAVISKGMSTRKRRVLTNLKKKKLEQGNEKEIPSSADDNQDCFDDDVDDNDEDYEPRVDEEHTNNILEEENEDQSSSFVGRKTRGWKNRRNIIHTCKLCGEEFKHGRPFNIHLKSHAEEGRVCCLWCKQEFYNHIVLIHHSCKHDMKVKGKTRQCALCTMKFTTLSKLQSHMKLVHNQRHTEKEFFCKFCNKGFVKKISMYAHYKEHAENQFVCQKCGEFIDTESEYREHLESHDKDAKFSCEICNLSFVRRQQYLQHMKAHEKYSCNQCNMSYNRLKLLTKHKKLAHQVRPPAEPKKYECPVCHKKLARPGLLDIHIRLHTGERPIECAVCHMYFRTPKAYAKHKETRTHLLRAGQLPREREHLCAVCGKAFFRKQALQRHLQYHNDERPHTCPHCDFRCKEPNNLKRHIALHYSSERNFVCDVCGAAFHTKRTLQTHHVYKHSSERNYQCPDCIQSFKTPNALRRHVRCHGTERPHKCFCGHAFLRLYNLRRHMKHVHGGDGELPPVRKLKVVDTPSVQVDTTESGKKDFADRSLQIKSMADRSLAEKAMLSVPGHNQVEYETVDPKALGLMSRVLPNSFLSHEHFQTDIPQDNCFTTPKDQSHFQSSSLQPTRHISNSLQGKAFESPEGLLQGQPSGVLPLQLLPTDTPQGDASTVVYGGYYPDPRALPFGHPLSPNQEGRTEHTPEVYAAMNNLMHFMHNAS